MDSYIESRTIRDFDSRLTNIDDLEFTDEIWKQLDSKTFISNKGNLRQNKPIRPTLINGKWMVKLQIHNKKPTWIHIDELVSKAFG